MSDRIDIEGLRVRTVIGIFDHERIRRQDVVLHLGLETDTRPAALSDDIADALDYKTITKRVIDFVAGTDYFLVERLAEEVASLVLAEFPVVRVHLRLEKPGALRYADTVALTIVRERQA